MYKRIDTETTITVVLSNQDIVDIAKNLSLIPKDWTFYSVEVKGNGTSQGANFIFKQITSNTDPEKTL